MTKREFLNGVVECCDDADLRKFAEDELAKMDATNAKRRENPKPSKDAIAAAERREQALLWLKSNEGEHDAVTIGEGCGMTDKQVPAALKSAISGGLVQKSIVKVDSKHRKTVYKFIGE